MSDWQKNMETVRGALGVVHMRPAYPALDALDAHIEQLEAVVRKAVRHVVEMGPCDAREEYSESAYCDEDNCTYCTMARALDEHANVGK